MSAEEASVKLSVSIGHDNDRFIACNLAGAAEYVSDFLSRGCGDDVAFSSGALSH